MNRCAVLGQPIAHSLSPLIHTRAYEVLGISADWTYGRHEVGIDGLADFIAACGPEWVGLSCTAPLKERLVELGEPSESARLLRSGNTYLFDHATGRGRVENTDVSGLVGALRRAGVQEAATAILLGNGATARSALLSMSWLGARSVLVLARDAARARASLGALADRLGIRLELARWGRVPDAQPADLLISTVPAPLPEEVALGLVELSAVCFEATYNHYPTALDRAGRAAGIVSLSGLDLLVGQALDQIRLMTGRDCPAQPLLEAARAAVEGVEDAPQRR